MSNPAIYGAALRSRDLAAALAGLALAIPHQGGGLSETVIALMGPVAMAYLMAGRPEVRDWRKLCQVFFWTMIPWSGLIAITGRMPHY